MAHQPSGSAQTECVRMPYDALPLSCRAFFFKVHRSLRGFTERGKEE
nr:hypothetical protein [uncultured Blautia sp.]